MLIYEEVLVLTIADPILQLGLDASAFNSIYLTDRRELAVEQPIHLPYKSASFGSRYSLGGCCRGRVRN